MKELIMKYAESMNKVEEARQELEKTCKEINLKYYKEPVVRVYNNQQAFYYLANGIKPLEIYPDVVAKRIVFVFRKAETKELYGKWLDGANRK